MDLQKLKQIDIILLASSLGIDVKKNKAYCYNGHDAKTQSLSFNTKTNTYKCFGCGDKGSTIDLVSQVKKISLKEAIKWLNQNYNLSFSNHIQSAPFIQKRESLKNKGADFSELYEWFVNTLILPTYIITYFKTRGISKSTLISFGIKYASDKDKSLLQEARNRFHRDKLLKSGLLKEVVNKETGEIFESLIFWDHIIFPFYNLSNVVYLQGRTLNKKYSKYLNLNGIEQVIYNSNILRTLEQNEELFICEGVMDVLSAYELGLNAIGILGASSFKTNFVPLLMDFNLKVVTHNDAGGDLFFKRIKESFLSRKKLIERVYVPKSYNDLNDYLIFENDKKGFTGLSDN